MRRKLIFLTGFLLLGCETATPHRYVAFEPPHVLDLQQVILDDGRTIPIPAPIAWDTNSEVFQKWSQVGNMTQLTDTDKQGRKLVGDFYCVYENPGNPRLYARLDHAIRYRTNGTREMETYYDPNGSPSKWISYTDDGLHEAVVVKQLHVRARAEACLQWVAVPDAKGQMQAYGLAGGESDTGTSLHLSGPLDVNEPL